MQSFGNSGRQVVGVHSQLPRLLMPLYPRQDPGRQRTLQLQAAPEVVVLAAPTPKVRAKAVDQPELKAGDGQDAAEKVLC